MATNQPTAVRFGRLDRQGLLLGLSGIQLGLVGTALIVVVATGLAAGPAGVLLSAPVWVAAIAWALVPVGGRPAVEGTPTAFAWLLRRLTGTATVLAPTRPKPSETLALPGLAGHLRIGEDAETGAALVRSARAVSGLTTVIADVRGPGFLLADAATQDRLVAGWGRLLGSLSQMPGVAGVQVQHRCVPARRSDLQQWWSTQASGRAAWVGTVATGLLDELPFSTKLQSRVAIAYRAGRGTDREAVLAALSEALRAAELNTHAWLSPQQVRSAIREAYDPDARPGASGDQPGPMGVTESWNHLRTDAGVHAVYWISEWPRSATHPGFLRTVVLAPGSRRTLSLLATPLPPGKALREIRRARAEQTADAMTRARIGRVEDESTRAASAELDRREQDLVAGHGDLRFTGLLAVSAASLDELHEETAASESAAAQAGCELRRLVGQQVQAFAAAALPLARVLP